MRGFKFRAQPLVTMPAPTLEQVSRTSIENIHVVQTPFYSVYVGSWLQVLCSSLGIEPAPWKRESIDDATKDEVC